MVSRTENDATAESKRVDPAVLKARVVGGIAVGVVWLVAVLLGRTFFSLLVATLIVLSIDELATLLSWRGFQVNRPVSMLSGALIAVLAFVAGAEGLLAGLALVLLLYLVRQTFLNIRFADTALNFSVILYIGALLSFLILLYEVKGGQAAVLVVLAGTWVSDMAAYFVGSRIGHTPLAPRISAKKTWEGAIAGLAAPALVVGALGAIPWIGLASPDILFGIAKGAAIGLVVGIVGPLGDLAESRIKRELNVKDSGDVIPGHGGFLDRLDSLLFTSAVVYYLWLVLAG